MRFLEQGSWRLLILHISTNDGSLARNKGICLVQSYIYLNLAPFWLRPIFLLQILLQKWNLNIEINLLWEQLIWCVQVLLLGHILTAEEAKNIGLVTEVLDGQTCKNMNLAQVTSNISDTTKSEILFLHNVQKIYSLYNQSHQTTPVGTIFFVTQRRAKAAQGRWVRQWQGKLSRWWGCHRRASGWGSLIIRPIVVCVQKMYLTAGREDDFWEVGPGSSSIRQTRKSAGWVFEVKD